jgi:hypothetical protein
MKAITNDVLAERMENHYSEIQKGLTRIEDRLDYMNGTQRKHNEDITKIKATMMTKESCNKTHGSLTKRATLNDFKTNMMWGGLGLIIMAVVTFLFNLTKYKFFGG